MKTLFLFPLFLLAACGTPVTHNSSTLQSVPSPMAGTTLDEGSTECLRSSEQLKAYPVGRYQDPNNPYVMHEGHTIYRAEQSPRWNLNPNAPVAVPLGPTVAVSDPAQQLSPVTAELEQKIQQQNQLIAATIEQNDRLGQEIHKLQDEQAKARDSIAAQEQLQQQLTQKEAELAESRKREADAEAQKNLQVVPKPALSWWQRTWRYLQTQKERK